MNHRAEAAYAACRSRSNALCNHNFMFLLPLRRHRVAQFQQATLLHIFEVFDIFAYPYLDLRLGVVSSCTAT